MPTANQRASYVAPLAAFLADDPPYILGHLAQGQGGDVNPAQRSAWMQQIAILKSTVPSGLNVPVTVCFEMVIPRIGKRADNVLLIGDQVVVVEFKVGSDMYDLDAKRQVVDYALDLKNFHQGSHEAIISPVLVATLAPAVAVKFEQSHGDVYPVASANAQSLAGSEFDVQGLELDWAVVAWDGDLIYEQDGWRYRAFKGTRWQEVRDEGARRYRLNAYRVLLTRARQGMVIVVPEGDADDPTRAPAIYDPTR